MSERYGFHVVLTTHKSRFSKRMIKYNVNWNVGKILSLKEEILVTKIIGSIIQEKKYNCIAYNICQDHVHLILVCDSYKVLAQIIKVIKGKSTFLYNKERDKLKLPKIEHLWSQKFFRGNLDGWTVGKFSQRPGEIYGSSYLENSLSYVQSNREKHKLSASLELQNVIDDFVVSLDEAYDV